MWKKKKGIFCIGAAQESLAKQDIRVVFIRPGQRAANCVAANLNCPLPQIPQAASTEYPLGKWALGWAWVEEVNRRWFLGIFLPRLKWVFSEALALLQGIYVSCPFARCSSNMKKIILFLAYFFLYLWIVLFSRMCHKFRFYHIIKFRVVRRAKINGTQIHVHTQMYINIYVCVYIWYVYVNIYINIHTYICMYVYGFVCSLYRINTAPVGNDSDLYTRI